MEFSSRFALAKIRHFSIPAKKILPPIKNNCVSLQIQIPHKMNIAIIGYGKMGRAIEALALQHGHTIVAAVDNDNDWNDPQKPWRNADVAIEFTTPDTATANIRRCLEADVPVVCGTTGWYSHYDDIVAECKNRSGRLFTATNFSIGMNIMFELNRRLAELMRGRDTYRVSISETHHIHKLDAPSGTAITLQEQIAESGSRQAESVPIESFRIGTIYKVLRKSVEDYIYKNHK